MIVLSTFFALQFIPVSPCWGERECIRIALNKRRSGTRERVHVLSHEISIRNAPCALVPQDYAPGAINLPLRGRPEIATFPAALVQRPSLPSLSRTSIHTGVTPEKGQTSPVWLTLRRLPGSTITFRSPREWARTVNFWYSFSRSLPRSFVDVSRKRRAYSENDRYREY